MSTDYNETVNQFHVGDYVREKGRTQVMQITSNIPRGGISVRHYLKTDKFLCEWNDKEGNAQKAVFDGKNLECA